MLVAMVTISFLSSIPSSTAVVLAYTYSYAQVAYLRWVPGNLRGLGVAWCL
jgi:hypothetical protein